MHKVWIEFHFFTCGYSIIAYGVPTIGYSFFYQITLVLLSKSINHICVGLFLDSLFCTIDLNKDLSFLQYHNIFKKIFIVVQLQLSPFSPITLPCPTHPPPTLNPLHPRCLCPWVLYTCSLT